MDIMTTVVTIMSIRDSTKQQENNFKKRLQHLWVIPTEEVANDGPQQQNISLCNFQFGQWQRTASS